MKQLAIGTLSALGIALFLFYANPIRAPKEISTSPAQLSLKADLPRQQLSPPKAEPKEDPDLMTFVQKYKSMTITETALWGLLNSDLSQNKKTVLLSLYLKSSGAFTKPEWGPLLVSLIVSSDQWPELANKACDALLLVNSHSDGALDQKLIEAFEALPADATVKRTALVFALFGRESIEQVRDFASSEAELDILTTKHARLLSQDERIDTFLHDKNKTSRTAYLNAYLEHASSRDELIHGLKLGIQDKEITADKRPLVLLSTARSKVPGKSQVLFDYWKSLLGESQHADFVSIFTVSLPQSAYSEADVRYVNEIVSWLLAQGPFDPKDYGDPRIELAIAMANACQDKTVDHKHCSKVDQLNKALKAKLNTDGLGSYL